MSYHFMKTEEPKTRVYVDSGNELTLGKGKKL